MVNGASVKYPEQLLDIWQLLYFLKGPICKGAKIDVKLCTLKLILLQSTLDDSVPPNSLLCI